MIETPTVLILGAGASMPFGFPSGRQLLQTICVRLKNEGKLFGYLIELGTSRPKIIEFRNSFEVLKPKEDTVVLLEATKVENAIIQDNIPIFGYRKYGSKICYYLNICQHSCTSDMQSPLRESLELYKYLVNIFKSIYEYNISGQHYNT